MKGMNMEELSPQARQVLQEMEAELAAKRSASDQEVLTRADKEFGSDPVSRGLASMATGIAQAGFETKDFIFGEPEEGKKSQTRRDVEALDRALDNESVGYGLTSGVSQMVVGLIGAGKLMAPVKAAQKLKTAGKAGRAAYETGKAAAASAVVLDPHEERLSDLVESFPALQNPVTDYLASDIEDSAAEGRFKNAIESIGVDFALLGALKVIKLLRAGKQDAAAKEIAKLERARAANVDAFGMDFGPTPQNAPSATHAAPSPSAEASMPMKAETPLSESPGASNADDEAEAIPNLTASPPKAEPPSAVPMMEVSMDDISAILKGTKSDIEAVSRFGSHEAAAEAGQIAARGASRLPWQKLHTPDGLRDFMSNAADTLKADMDKAKGEDILRDTEVAEKVRQMADYFGDDPSTIMGELAESGQHASLMTSRMEAAYLISNRVFQETYETAVKLRNGMLDEWGGDTAKATLELKDRLRVAATVFASAQAMRSAAGRSMQRLRGQYRLTPADLEGINSLDAEQLADLLYSTKGDPKKLAQTANPTFLRRMTNEANFLLQNNLLWGWPTHLVNLTSNTLMMVGRPTEKLLGAIALGPKSGGDILRRQAIEEYSATVAALGDGWTAAVEAFKRGDSKLAPHNTEFFQGAVQQQALPWKPVTGLMDIVENAWRSANYRNLVGLPTRSLGAADEFFKTLRYRAYVQGQAASRAHGLGLKGQDYQRYIREELEKAIDPASGKALDSRALREAQATTFQNELLAGTAGATIQQARNRHPILTLILPFVKTPVNVLRYGWKMTPGLNLLQKEFREAWRGAHGEEAKAHAIGQMALGSIFMGLSATLALNGRMTGSGPKDPRLQAELKASGWQPYSYVIENDDGTKTYINMGRFDPISMAMGLMADLVDLARHDPENSGAEMGMGAVAMSLAKSFTDRTFLQNINQTLEALSDPDGKRAERWLGTIAGNLVPLSSGLRQVNPDPYMREARSLVDNIMKNVPGFSQTLPPRRNFMGEPIWRRTGLVMDNDADEVEAEHNRIMIETDRGIGSVDPDLDGTDLRDITLDTGQNAYDRLQELSGHIPGEKPLKAHLAKLIRSNTYQDLPDGDSGVKGTRLNALGRLVGQYRTAAKKVLLREAPELRLLVKSRQRAAHGAYLKNKGVRKSEASARALLEALSPQGTPSGQ
ncbi:hypothetical protein [Nitratireductor sp. L15S-10]|uniref:hypothetical protein n=1 Tax=Nitratireductor sp. L15S-10 TaxID=3034028 RepID=UPI0038575058